MNSTQDDENMPKLPGPPIFTTMMTQSGAKIHLVGVMHRSKKSREDVLNVIRHTQPNVVFLELCEQSEDISYQEKNHNIWHGLTRKQMVSNE